MGQHTWFYKNRELRKKEFDLWKKLADHDSGIAYLNDSEIYQIEQEIKEINESNTAEYHNLFRTSKMTEDGTYTDDEICSKEECLKWLEDNKETVSFKWVYYETEQEEEQRRIVALKQLDEFWEKYPKGYIDFG